MQILLNLGHFEIASQNLEHLLADARSISLTSGPVILMSTEQFRISQKTAEKRIFELVNSKLDDLIEGSQYEWFVEVHRLDAPKTKGYHRMARRSNGEVSGYVQELTRYLSNIMSTTLLGLPPDIKGFIYFDALNHAANLILVFSCSPYVTNFRL